MSKLDQMTQRTVREMIKSEVIPDPLEAFLVRVNELLHSCSPEKQILQADIAVAIAAFELFQGNRTPELLLGDRTDSEVQAIRRTFMPGKPLPSDLCVDVDTPVLAKFRKKWQDGTFFAAHSDKEVKVAFPNDRSQFRILPIEDVRIVDAPSEPEVAGKKK